MDHQKDIRNTDTNPTSEVSVPNAVALAMHNLSLFKEKSIKMASALHLVTDLFKETEPIREALREQAIALVMVAGDRRLAESSEATDNARYVLDTTMSLITVLNTSRLLSDMNTHIIRNELQALVTLLGGMAVPSTTLSEMMLHELFVTPLPAAMQGSAAVIQPETSSSIIEQRPVSETPRVIAKDTPATPAARTATQSKTQQPAIKKTSTPMTKGDRRKQILAAITKEGSSIKDIAHAVAGCSEKTIQRELNTLIAHGTVVREGEKRWSVYKKT